jgi:hypothetical protein
MEKIYRIQPAPVVDAIGEDGSPRHRVPWPVCAREDGSVNNYGREHPELPVQVIGFQDRLDVHHVDVFWDEAKARPQEMVGKYLVTVDGAGTLAVDLTAVSDIAIIGGEQK